MNSQQRRKQRRLEANIAAQEFKASPCGDSAVEWLDAAAADGSRQKPKKFGGTAYSGGILYANLPFPTVVDIEGMDTSNAAVSLLDHNPSARVGHITAVDKGANRKVKITGEISASGEAAQMVASDAQSGFPWQFSIAGPITKQEFVKAGDKVTVNGRSFTGPIIVARQMLLREVSFVAIGADASTSASFAASASKGSGNMGFSAWLAAKGIDESTLTDAVQSTLKASYELENAPKQPPAKPDVVNLNASGDIVASEVKGIKETVSQLQAMIAEQSRIASINSRDIPADMKAKAISAGMTADAIELEYRRASRPVGPAIHVANNVITNEVLEAAICQTRKHPDVEKRFKPEVLEASHQAFHGRVGLQQILLTCAASNGYNAMPGERLSTSTFSKALEACRLQAGFSGISLPNILSNVANKELLMGYMEGDQTWREISRITSVPDFKQATSYRLLDSMEYEQVGAGGKISHGKVDEEYYTRQIKTYAKMLTLDRVTFINDDMGAFDDLRIRIGRGAAKKLSNVFWAKFMDNSTFFTTARTNYISGSTTNLATDGVGLGLGVKAFRKMTTPTGDGSKRIGVGANPSLLLVPPELEGVAEALYQNQNLGAVASSSANIYARKYRPLVVSWLSDSSFTGYSDTAWYLLQDPQVMAPMVVSFLNGVEAPTVEASDAEFDTLGISFRGYHDFGCDQAEYLAGIKSKGAA